MSDIPAIAAEGLVKTYGKKRALAGLDLTVPQGTVYGLLGPNGAGKPVTGLRHSWLGFTGAESAHRDQA